MRGMKKANKSQNAQRAKAARVMEPGILALSKPQARPANPKAIKPPKEAAAVKRQKMANERPIAFKEGGKVAGYAAGGAAKVRKGVATPSGAPKNAVPRAKVGRY